MMKNIKSGHKIKQLTKIFLILTGLFTCPVFAQEELSLSQAIGKALKNNYSIQVTKMNEEIASLNNHWGTAGRYPSINLNMGLTNQKNVNDDEDFLQNRLASSVDVNWVLFDGFSVKITKARLEELEELAKGNSAVLIENTIQGVILTYYMALLEKEKLRVIKQLMQLSNDRYEREMHRKNTGVSVTYDVLQAQNAYLEDKSNYLKQEVRYKNVLRDLNYIMGEEITASYQLPEEFSPPERDYLLSDLKEKMQSGNKTLLNQYIYQSLLRKDLALAKSNLYPAVSLRTGIESITNRMDYDLRDPATANSYALYGNLTLSYHLFNGEITQRAIRIARIKEEIGQVETSEILHSLLNELMNLYDWFEVYKTLVQVADELVKTAELNLQISEEKFKAGAINSFNFRDVQLIYLNASVNRLNAVYDLLSAHVSLLRITGGIIGEYGEE